MSKNIIEAERHRQIGNKLFAKAKYCEALLSYNHSLCFSEDNSENAALAFANRSAAYMELREYELCLENIELAKASGYPRDKMEKLNTREIECKRLMQTYEKDPDDDPLNFFKLSYPANKKLPCLVECLELKSNDQHEKFIITNQDLKAGDIIASSESIFNFALPKARLHICSYCIKNSMKLSLIPCSKCCKAMYCSKECMEADSKEFHKLQCGSDNPNMAMFEKSHTDLKGFKMFLHILASFDGDVNEMRKFFEKNKARKTVFDFDLSNKDDPMYKKNMFLAVISLEGKPGKFGIKTLMLRAYHSIINSYPSLKSIWDSRENKKFLDNFLFKLSYEIMGPSYANNFCKIKLSLEESYPSDDLHSHGEKTIALSDGWNRNSCAVSYDPYYSLLSHNCFPNIATKSIGDKSYWIVLRPIKSGETISKSCLGGPVFNQEKSVRQASIKCLTGKVCSCEGCLKDWPSELKMPKLKEIIPRDKIFQGMFMDYLLIRNEHKRDFAKFAMVINSMEDYFPCMESATCQLSLMFKLYVLALPAPWFNQGK